MDPNPVTNQVFNILKSKGLSLGNFAISNSINAFAFAVVIEDSTWSQIINLNN